MKIAQVIILMGTICTSPIEQAPGLTVASKVPCAVIVGAKDEPKPEIRPDAAIPEPARAIEPPPAAKAPVKRHKPASARPDRCGSQRVVWYTNKRGERKYRCR